VRNLIREKKFGALTTYVEQQAAQRAESRRLSGK